MMVLVTYDVDYSDNNSAKRLRQIAKICENVGQRVQKSVFEIIVDPAQFVTLKTNLLKAMDSEKDSVRIYFLGANWERRIEHYGAIPIFEQEKAIIL